MMNLFGGLYRDLLAILAEDQIDPESGAEKFLDPFKPSVVFVSGLGAPSRALQILKRRLLRDGYNVVLFSMHWQEVNGGIPEMARILAAEVTHLRKFVGPAPIHLVAHSAGGIVARYYVQMLGGSHYCDSLTTLATPHHGTWLALLGFLSHLALVGRCLLQMSPGSSVLKKLNSTTMPIDIRMVSVFSVDDMLCPSSTSKVPQRLSGLPNVTSVKIDGLSHSDFILSKRGYRIIQKVLEARRSADDILAAIHA